MLFLARLRERGKRRENASSSTIQLLIGIEKDMIVFIN